MKPELSSVLNRLEELFSEEPPEYLCPISQQLMEDPVMTVIGSTYDRISIQRWFIDNTRDPLTNQVLPNRTLIPNRSLKASVERFLHQKNFIQRLKVLIREQGDYQMAHQIYLREQEAQDRKRQMSLNQSSSFSSSPYFSPLSSLERVSTSSSSSSTSSDYSRPAFPKESEFSNSPFSMVGRQQMIIQIMSFVEALGVFVKCSPEEAHYLVGLCVNSLMLGRDQYGAFLRDISQSNLTFQRESGNFIQVYLEKNLFIWDIAGDRQFADEIIGALFHQKLPELRARYEPKLRNPF